MFQTHRTPELRLTPCCAHCQRSASHTLQYVTASHQNCISPILSVVWESPTELQVCCSKSECQLDMKALIKMPKEACLTERYFLDKWILHHGFATIGHRISIRNPSDGKIAFKCQENMIQNLCPSSSPLSPPNALYSVPH